MLRIVESVPSSQLLPAHPPEAAGRYGKERHTLTEESAIHRPQVTSESGLTGHGIERMSPWRELAARLRERDHSALEELFNLTSGRAFGLAYRVLEDGPAAEDVVQDAFLWVWNNAERIDPHRGSVESLLLTIVHRRAIDSVRKRVRRDALAAEAPDDAIDERARDLADAVLESLDIEKVESALTHLNPDQRAAIELAYFKGLTHTEIAERLSIPVGTVKSRMRLGLAALRQAFGLGRAPSGGAEDGASSCDEVSDLIPAYVLGSATPEERRTVARHLQDCDLHDDMVSSGATALLLAHAAPEVEAPIGLKSRVLAAAERDRPAIQDGAIVPVRPAGGLAGRKFVGGYGIAAAMAIALGAMVVWNVMLQMEEDPELIVHSYYGNEDDWLRIETVLGSQGAEASFGGLERLAGDERYHLWVTRGGDDVLFVRAFNTNEEGRWAGEFSFAFEDGDLVAITVQQSDSGGPVGDVVLRTEF